MEGRFLLVEGRFLLVAGRILLVDALGDLSHQAAEGREGHDGARDDDHHTAKTKTRRLLPLLRVARFVPGQRRQLAPPAASCCYVWVRACVHV